MPSQFQDAAVTFSVPAEMTIEPEPFEERISILSESGTLAPLGELSETWTGESYFRFEATDEETTDFGVTNEPVEDIGPFLPSTEP